MRPASFRFRRFDVPAFRRFLPLLALVHPFHVTVAEVEVNREAGRLEVALRVAPEDLAAALERRAGRAVDLDDPGADGLIADLLGDVFRVEPVAGGSVAAAHDVEWVGKEMSLEVGWLYFEIDLPGELRGGRVSNRVFFEQFPEQINIVSVRDGAWRTSLTCTREAAWATVPAVESQERANVTSDAAAPGDGPLVLPHVVRVEVDKPTFAAITAAPFTASGFAGMDPGLRWYADPGADGPRRVFVRGRATMLEIVAPGAGPGAPAGDALGFVVERADELDALHAALEPRVPGLTRSLRRWNPGAGERAVPWLHVLEPAGGERALHAWIGRYDEGFLAALHPFRPAEQAGTRRRDVLSGHFREDGHLEDLRAVTVTLEAPERDELTRLLEASGYARRDRTDRTILEGPHFQVTVLAPAEGRAPGVTAVRMSLLRNVAGQQVYRFGTGSILSFFPDRTAVWLFE